MRSWALWCGCGVLIAWLAATSAAAEEVDLSLERSVELARRRSFALAARGQEVEAARARVREARGQFFPTLEMAGRAQVVNEVEPQVLGAPGLPSDIAFGEPIDRIVWSRASVTQPLFAGLRRIRAHEAAELGVEVGERRRDEADADLMLRVCELYFGLYRARALTDVALASVRAVEAHLENLRQLADVGRATQLDVSHAEAQLADARVQLLEARGAEKVAADALNTLLGLSRGTRVSLRDEPRARAQPVPGEERLLEMALSERPELRTARRRADLEEARVEVEKAAWFPLVSAVAGFTVASPHERYAPPTEDFDNSWDIGLAASWSLDFGVTSARVAEARHRGAAARYRVRALEDETSSEVQRRLSELETAGERVTAARRAADAAQEAFDQARLLFEAERLDSADLLDRELDLRRARARVLDARVERTLARARLARLLGSAAITDRRPRD